MDLLQGGLLHAIPDVTRNGILLEERDGGDVRVISAKGLKLQAAGATELELDDVAIDVLITDARVALACSKYEKGGGWTGFGLSSIVVATAPNAGSKALAAHRRRGKMLVGQVRYPWLAAAGSSNKTGWLSEERLILSVRIDDGVARLWLTLPKSTDARRRGGRGGTALGGSPAHRLLCEPAMSDELRASLHELAAAGRLEPEKGKTQHHVFRMSWRVGEKSARITPHAAPARLLPVCRWGPEQRRRMGAGLGTGLGRLFGSPAVLRGWSRHRCAGSPHEAAHGTNGGGGEMNGRAARTMNEATREASAGRPVVRSHAGRPFGVGICVGAVLALLACAWALGVRPAAASGASQGTPVASTAREARRLPARAVKTVLDAGPVFMDPATKLDCDDFGRVPSVKAQVEFWARGIEDRIRHGFRIDSVELRGFASPVDADPGDPDIAGRQTSAANRVLADRRAREVRRLLLARLSQGLSPREMDGVAHRIRIRPGIEVRDGGVAHTVRWLAKHAAVPAEAYIEMTEQMDERDMDSDQRIIMGSWRRDRSVLIEVRASMWAPRGQFK